MVADIAVILSAADNICLISVTSVPIALWPNHKGWKCFFYIAHSKTVFELSQSTDSSVALSPCILRVDNNLSKKANVNLKMGGYI